MVGNYQRYSAAGPGVGEGAVAVGFDMIIRRLKCPLEARFQLDNDRLNTLRFNTRNETGTTGERHWIKSRERDPPLGRKRTRRLGS
jgi:hypothetical protein